jgi:hypothetical protein
MASSEQLPVMRTCYVFRVASCELKDQDVKSLPRNSKPVTRDKLESDQ